MMGWGCLGLRKGRQIRCLSEGDVWGYAYNGGILSHWLSQLLLHFIQIAQTNLFLLSTPILHLRQHPLGPRSEGRLERREGGRKEILASFGHDPGRQVDRGALALRVRADH